MNLTRTAKAVEDIESCLLWSAENFGIPAARRYRALLEVALLAILEDPELCGSKLMEGFDGKVRIYHLRHSRKAAPVGGLIVKNPRHFIVYRITSDRAIELLRVLHERMDFETQMNG
ncbi:MAG TPA: type II toxin-antitoxin system RelE/ParE family toxin [Prosthecobacter sp.]|nr:type II toxin-antitoxin system RelE/ParE family toxin [Prosthecobacter sp.]HRK16913.1 type II toxin-antitoxin system RelE/ParE family toxin [Prosthecobacter sp.]